jgi:hypothetical protein
MTTPELTDRNDAVPAISRAADLGTANSATNGISLRRVLVPKNLPPDARRLACFSFGSFPANFKSGAQHPGGLASSHVDMEGFTWDIGGHVQFSHYKYFDEAMHDFLGRDGWLQHDRESWVWIRDRFVPYPFQNNIHRLPNVDLDKCLQGLVEITRQPLLNVSNFRDWIHAQFGRGMAEVFFIPYNLKTWAHPLEAMSAEWVGDRVAVTDLGRVLSNLVNGRDDVVLGP